MWIKSIWSYLLYGLLFGQKVAALDLQVDDEREFCLILFQIRWKCGN